MNQKKMAKVISKVVVTTMSCGKRVRLHPLRAVDSMFVGAQNGCENRLQAHPLLLERVLLLLLHPRKGVFSKEKGEGKEVWRSLSVPAQSRTQQQHAKKKKWEKPTITNGFSLFLVGCNVI